MNPSQWAHFRAGVMEITGCSYVPGKRSSLGWALRGMTHAAARQFLLFLRIIAMAHVEVPQRQIHKCRPYGKDASEFASLFAADATAGTTATAEGESQPASVYGVTLDELEKLLPNFMFVKGTMGPMSAFANVFSNDVQLFENTDKVLKMANAFVWTPVDGKSTEKTSIRNNMAALAAELLRMQTDRSYRPTERVSHYGIKPFRDVVGTVNAEADGYIWAIRNTSVANVTELKVALTED